MKLKTEVHNKEQIIRQKEQRIKVVNQPLREETYVEDLYKNIGFKLTKEQYKKILSSEVSGLRLKKPMSLKNIFGVL